MLTDASSSDTTSARVLLSPVIIVSALGYFVDVFDLILFSVVRIQSLKDLGLSPDRVTCEGVFLINCQMIGMLLGGIFWGVLGDKIGRVKVLFGSILTYSLANIANALISTTAEYAALRFIAGIGLAGEIGAGITLVAELLPQRLRGYGTTIVAAVGVLGAVFAGVIGEILPWRLSFFVGGVLGLILLALRLSVHESHLFSSFRAAPKDQDGIVRLLLRPHRVGRYALCILIGLPTWFVAGILMTFSPEITSALGAPQSPKVGMVVVACYVGLFLGDASSGVISQLLQSRKRALVLFLLLGAASGMLLLSLEAPSLTVIYSVYMLVGFAAGFWVLTLTTAAEQFGTNLRATVATTVPNFIRGALVPMTLLFQELKDGWGVIGSASGVMLLCYTCAALALWRLRETFWVDLDFLETDPPHAKQTTPR
jgi:MFS transporter, putative metabolite:H+ symporter